MLFVFILAFFVCYKKCCVSADFSENLFYPSSSSFYLQLFDFVFLYVCVYSHFNSSSGSNNLHIHTQALSPSVSPSERKKHHRFKLLERNKKREKKPHRINQWTFRFDFIKLIIWTSQCGMKIWRKKTMKSLINNNF